MTDSRFRFWLALGGILVLFLFSLAALSPHLRLLGQVVPPPATGYCCDVPGSKNTCVLKDPATCPAPGIFVAGVGVPSKDACQNLICGVAGPAVCGDAKLQTGEQCDDGNTVAGDGCSDTCQFEGPPPPGGPVAPQCSDTKDNDVDGLIDSNDLGCYVAGNYDPAKTSESDPVCSDEYAMIIVSNGWAEDRGTFPYRAGGQQVVCWGLGGGYTLASAACLFNPYGACYSLACLYKRPTSRPLAYTATRWGYSSPVEGHVSCMQQSQSPPPGYTLKSWGCAIYDNKGECISDVCFWEKAGVTTSSDLMLTSVGGAIFGPSQSCYPSTDPGAPYNIVTGMCMLSLRAVCSNSVCLWQKDVKTELCLPPITCSNGVINPGEQCDDGNTASGDGCSFLCTIETSTCASGTICPTGAPCPANGVCPNLCGNAVLDAGEQCDDGNQVNADSCTNACLFPCVPGTVCPDGQVCPANGVCPSSCGNGVVDPGEQCDLGLFNGLSNSGCSATCTGGPCTPGSICPNGAQCPPNGVCPNLCGNGTLDPGEQCDDANQIDTDACTNSCFLRCVPDAICPDGSVCPANGVCPPATHLACANNACTVVIGAGLATCTTNLNCAVNPTHLICSNNACTPVAGNGVDQCSSNVNCMGGSSSSSSKNSSSTSGNSSSNSNNSSSSSNNSSSGNNSSGSSSGNSSSGSSSGNSSLSSSSSQRPACPSDPCGAGGNTYCAQRKAACTADPASSSCIRCSGTFTCKGNECAVGGNAYCAALGNNTTCVTITSGICIDCRAGGSSSASNASSSSRYVCAGNECGKGGDAYCAAFGKQCSSDLSSNSCINCVPGPALQCSGTDTECNQGGSTYCKNTFGASATCVPSSTGICIVCKQPGSCSGTDYECTHGGSQYCSTVYGDTCRSASDGICIECGPESGHPSPYQCVGNECRIGGAAYCSQWGQGCKNIPDGICITCTADTACASDLECAQGSLCVNKECVQFCGNGRLDPGEVCDPTVPGSQAGCSVSCLLGQSQQCSRDTECASGLCIKNVCLPCTNDSQCQSDVCRSGACINLCGNGKVDPGEVCDSGLAGSSPDCTRDCLLPAGTACSKTHECQTGLCGGGSCTSCTRNDQCAASNLCVSGNCVDVCGNGTVDVQEQCDDGNRVSGDGCSRFCERETGVAGQILPVNLLGDISQGAAGDRTIGVDGTVGGAVDAAGARRIATSHETAGKTGPAAVVAIAAGAAAGWAWVRRRRRSGEG